MSIRPANPTGATRHGWLPRLAWLLLAALPCVALAQNALQHLGPADRAEIASFKLDTDVLARLQAVVAESHRMSVRKQQLDMSQVHSLDDMARQLVAVDPRIQSLLARNGFTPHQFVVANLALVTAALAVNMKRQGGQAANMPETANMRFYERHEAQIGRMMQSASQ